jgi:type IV pilus assembly protein PilW
MKRGPWVQRGVSLVELMVAMVLGLLVSAGVMAAFTSSSRADRVRTQLERLQEEGRFAITQIRNDLVMTGMTYCAGTGGNAHATAAGPYLDELRAPTVYASEAGVLKTALNDVTTSWGSPYPSAPVQPYSLPSFFAMRGYDCSVSACKPVDPGNKGNPAGLGIAAMGTAVDARVVGASVLTVRYLDPSGGWALAPEGGVVVGADGSLAIDLNTASPKASTRSFPMGHPLAMLADCSSAQIFAVSGQGTSQLVSSASNFTQPAFIRNAVAPKLFDLSRDWRTVTYYLKVVDNGEGKGHTTGALVRRINGGSTAGGRDGSAEEIARGVERLDFKYGVQKADGSVRYYTAEQVDNSSRQDCPSVPWPIPGSADHGCLWRSVSLIEIDLLMDGQLPLYSLTADELAYPYASDGLLEAASPTAGERKVTPLQQGFPLPMLRREFTAVAALRNANP